MHGAYNIPRMLISDIDAFIRTKGLSGIGNTVEEEEEEEEEEATNEKGKKEMDQIDPFRPKYGDTVLLTLMHLLEKEIFNNTSNDEQKLRPEPEFSTSYVISNRESYNNNNDNNDDDDILLPFMWTKIVDN